MTNYCFDPCRAPTFHRNCARKRKDVDHFILKKLDRALGIEGQSRSSISLISFEPKIRPNSNVLSSFSIFELILFFLLNATIKVYT